MHRIAQWIETSDSTDPVKYFTWCFGDDFKARKIKSPIVLCWLVLQIVGLTFQLFLYSEIAQHEADFVDTLRMYCGEAAICLGPHWNVSFSGSLSFPPSSSNEEGFDFVLPTDQFFNFRIMSHPATFIVCADPRPPHTNAQYKLSIATRDGWAALARGSKMLLGTGMKCKVVVDDAKAIHDSWTASMTLSSSFSEATTVDVFVVDSRIAHLDEIHKEQQCSFENSWLSFNERHNGQHHRTLVYARQATFLFMSVSGALSLLMLRRFFSSVEVGKLLSRMIIFKLLFQDLPQQVCIVAYLHAWYSPNGMRCQMCLFHPSHCDNGFALNWTVFMVCVITVLSSCANQILLQAKVRQRYFDDEECFQYFMRAVIFSVSVLPFSTGVFVLSRSVLNVKSAIVLFLAGIPALIGWGTVLCVPVFSLCEDDFSC